MSQITTHILDTTKGRPAQGVTIALAQQTGDNWQEIARGVTNADGRIANLLPPEMQLELGVYKMKFFTQEYFAQAVRVVAAMRTEIDRAFTGQLAVVDQVLAAILAGGHVLLEGVPGLGKTLLVRAIARTFDGQFARIQFTPDLLPADVTGHVMFDQSKQVFVTRRGPVFTNLLLADEINRAPAKTQSALLEVM